MRRHDEGECGPVAGLGDRGGQLLRSAGAAAVGALDRVSPGATRSTLQVLLYSCPLGWNHMLVMDAGATHEAIELELDDAPSSPSFS